MKRSNVPDSGNRPSGFTLIELLVVIAVIAMLLGLLLPAVQSARETARRNQCKNRLKQLALAVHNFHDVELAVPAMDLGSGWATWAVLLLPYLEQNNLYAAWDLRRQYFVQDPPQSTGRDLPIFHCPSQVRSGANAPRSTGDTLWVLSSPPPLSLGPGPPGWSDFVGVGGTDLTYSDGPFRRAIDRTTSQKIVTPTPLTAKSTINPWRHPVSFSDLNVDGLSNTLLFGEKYLATNDTSVFNGRIQSGYVRVCGIGRPIGGPNRESNDTSGTRLGSAHPNACHFAFADGHVFSMSVTTDEAILHRLAKVADGAVVPEF